MKILLTGVTGYIGKRLLPYLLENGHEVVCLVRDPRRFQDKLSNNPKLHLIKADLLDYDSLLSIPNDIDIAYYFVHSMGSSKSDFLELESKAAHNFVNAINLTETRQIIYLSGIISNEMKSMVHLVVVLKNIRKLNSINGTNK